MTALRISHDDSSLPASPARKALDRLISRCGRHHARSRFPADRVLKARAELLAAVLLNAWTRPTVHVIESDFTQPADFNQRHFWRLETRMHCVKDIRCQRCQRTAPNTPSSSTSARLLRTAQSDVGPISAVLWGTIHYCEPYRNKFM